MKKKALVVLLAGFSRKASMEIERHLDGHQIHRAGGLTDVRHKINDQKYSVLILNADSYGNNDISEVNELQNKTVSHTIAVHGNKSKRRPIKGERLVFLPMKKVARHLPDVIGEWSTA